MNSQLFKISRPGKLFLLAVAWACLCIPAQAKRKDMVVMDNGDHFTGEVKRLQNGLLFVEMPYVTGNVGLDWNQVASVQSSATYRITLKDGHTLVGKIEKSTKEIAGAEEFTVQEAARQVQVPSETVVEFDTHKPNFWRQLQGAIDFGYSFTSGNSQSNLNASSNAKYVARAWEAGVAFDSSFNGQTGGSETNRQDLQGIGARFLNRNSFVLGLSDFLHSSQQDLELRSTLGGGYGRFLVRTPNSNLSWVGGLVYTHETFTTIATQPSDQNMEAVLGLNYYLYRFNFGEVNSQLLVFPGLTDSGRVRATTNNSLTIKLVNNFHLTFTIWDNFDSRPPVVTAKKNELGVSSGIGWAF